jgi:hypothetical protein
MRIRAPRPLRGPLHPDEKAHRLRWLPHRSEDGIERSVIPAHWVGESTQPHSTWAQQE